MEVLAQPDREASWLDYVAAFGTAGAAVVAAIALLLTLYLNVWRERRRQPKLSLGVVKSESYATSWDPYADEEPDWAYAPLDLALSNDNGRRTARDVEVLITADRGVWGEPAVADWEWFEDEIELRRLAWVHGRGWEEWRDTPADVPAGLTRRVRVGALGSPNALLRQLPVGVIDVEPSKVVALGRLGLLTALPLSPDPQAQYWLENDYGKYGGRGAHWRLRFTIVGSNIDAVQYSTSLRVTAEPRDGGRHDVRAIWGPFKNESGRASK